MMRTVLHHVPGSAHASKTTFILDGWSINNIKPAVGAIWYPWPCTSSHSYSPDPLWQYAFGGSVLVSSTRMLIFLATSEELRRHA